MFESLPDLASLATADDATVVAAIEGGARAEAAAAAVRLAAIAELIERRCGEDDGDGVGVDPRDFWACDGWDSAAAEVAAALTISHRRASNQMHLARGLRDRLPKTAALLANGHISAPTASTISWRTHLVEDDTAMAAIDAAIAAQASNWGSLSAPLLDAAIDAMLEEHDPEARLQYHAAARGRDIGFGKPEDSTGTSSVWGRVYNTDAKLFERRIAAIIATLCRDDPRTMGERRSDAFGAIAAGVEGLACRCGKPDCPNSTAETRAAAVAIHVVADEHALAAARAELAAQVQQESAAVQERAAKRPVSAEQPEGADPENSAPDAAPEAARPRSTFRAALIRGGGVVPTPLLAELLRNGATIAPLREPSPLDEPRYRPSAKLDAFIRSRDLTCRFPGCTAAAEYCDVDHTIAHPEGCTHPAKLKCR